MAKPKEIKKLTMKRDAMLMPMKDGSQGAD
jgi:hypothetical protein